MVIQWMVDQVLPKTKKGQLLEELKTLKKGKVSCERERYIAVQLCKIGVSRSEVARLVGRSEETIRMWG